MATAAAAAEGGPLRLGTQGYFYESTHHHEDIQHHVSLSVFGLPLLHPEVLRGEPPFPHQSALQDQPDQTGPQGDGGAPQA